MYKEGWKCWGIDVSRISPHITKDRSWWRNIPASPSLFETIVRHVLQSPRGPQQGQVLIAHRSNLLNLPCIVSLPSLSLLPVLLGITFKINYFQINYLHLYSFTGSACRGNPSYQSGFSQETGLTVRRENLPSYFKQENLT